MTSSLVCLGHSPLVTCFARAPKEWGGFLDALAARRAAVEAYAPDVVVAFMSDHFNGFFLDLMPAFCVGTSAAATDDVGGTPGVLDVPSAGALRLASHLRESGVDVAVSRRMTVDHAISQSLSMLTGALDRYPLIPIFVNCINEPFTPFHRVRALGEAVGRHFAASGQRVLFLGSGGMSHNPTRYYPAFGTGAPEVTQYQLHGGRDGLSMTGEQWRARLLEMHLEGAQMLVSGARTKADLKLNADLDRWFLSLVADGRLHELDRRDPAEFVASGGIGWLELNTWYAACAAHAASGGAPPVVDFYAEMLEIGIAMGVVHAG